MSYVYLIGSLSNPRIPALANQLEADGVPCFDAWFSPGPDTDSQWRAHELCRGRSYIEALAGPHAQNVFHFDKRWIDGASAVVLVAPAGRSAHLELGYVIGQGKPGFILLDEPNPPRWDVMAAFATRVFDDPLALTAALKELL